MQWINNEFYCLRCYAAPRLQLYLRYTCRFYVNWCNNSSFFGTSAKSHIIQIRMNPRRLCTHLHHCTQHKPTAIIITVLFTIFCVRVINPIFEQSLATIRLQSTTKTGRAVTPERVVPKQNISYAEYLPKGFEFEADVTVNYQFSDSPKQEGYGFTLITMFNLFTGQGVDGYEKETVESLVLRNSEYLTTIRENINHPILKKIILFYEDENSTKILLAQNWKNITKVHPVKLNRLIHMSDFFNYSSSYLLDVPVIASNGDIIIGEHFDKIDIDRLRDTKTLYSLTRHGNKGFGDCEANSMCLMEYYGSHDTHVFRLSEPISKATLDILNYPVNLQKSENAMISAVTEEGFTVYNPCSVLTTYHIHCSRIGKRMIQGRDSVMAAPWLIHKWRIVAPTQQLEYANRQ